MKQNNKALPVQYNVSGQRGLVLIVVLVMLGIFSVIVVSMLGGSNINFRIAGNQQYHIESKSAARHAIESFISNPANFAIPLPAGNTEFSNDFNGDGKTDLVAVVAPPSCLSTDPIKQVELDVSDPADAQCLGTGKGVAGGVLTDDGAALQGNSWCTKMRWDIAANVSDGKTGSHLAMHQGIYLREVIGTPCLN